MWRGPGELLLERRPDLVLHLQVRSLVLGLFLVALERFLEDPVVAVGGDSIQL